MRRNYSDKTLKILFTLSGNQCAYPGCRTTLIEPATDSSGELVTADICHIYAISKDGPRGKSGLTQKELNSQENLILLCRHHHSVVAGQHETYPAELLKEWKHAHESEMRKRLSPDLGSLQADISLIRYFPKELVDKEIEKEVEILRKSGLFQEFDLVNRSLELGTRLVKEDLYGGSKAVRSRALAWCARLLSHPGELDKAEEYLKLAKRLGTGFEIDIAEAFITSRKGNKREALKSLARIDSPCSRAAALMVVAHHEDKKRVRPKRSKVPKNLWVRNDKCGFHIPIIG